jgi:UDP-N-acetyl-D-glucosamine dehydrogenase
VENTEFVSQEDIHAVSDRSDCTVIITDHTAVDYVGVLENSRLVVDTRNALKGVSSDKIVRL